MEHEHPTPGAGRLAPSPTGGLHLGHARTFLVAWLAARAAGDRVILRIEDLDAARARPEALASIPVDLRWLGLDWDEGPDVGGPHSPYVQSERMSAYGEVIERLQTANSIYPCTCTRADIARAATAPHEGDEGPVYPGTCSGRLADDVAALIRAGTAFAWRFRSPNGSIAWDDRVLGPVALPAGGDFVVGRSSGEAAYQLAVVVDDAAMGVRQVVRGDDLASSTPRQLSLYEALNLEPPTFAHVPLVVGPDGKRLAKRDGSIKLATLRERGVEPGELIGRLAMSCGWSDRVEPSWPRDWIGRFDWDRLPKGPWVAPDEWLRVRP